MLHIELLWINQQLQLLVLLSVAWHVGFPCVPGIKFRELGIVHWGCVLFLSWHRLMHQQLNMLENSSGLSPVTLSNSEYFTWHLRLQELRGLELCLSAWVLAFVQHLVEQGGVPAQQSCFLMPWLSISRVKLLGNLMLWLTNPTKLLQARFLKNWNFKIYSLTSYEC